MEENHPTPEEYRPRKMRVKKSGELWLLSFADLSMILISFFILMLSFADMNKQKAETIAEEMKKQIKNKEAEVKPDSIIKISSRLNEAIKKLKLDQSAQITYDSAGLSVEFKDGLLFGFGSAEPNPQSKQVVKKIMDVIAETPEKYSLRFEGHTDDVPIAGGKYPTNWELSSSRGIKMMHEFELRGVAPQRMSVIAYAHTRPKIPFEKLHGKELEQARAQNRRVVIRIE